MTRKVLIIIGIIVLIGGCIFDKKMNQDDDIERLYLSDKYYNDGVYIGVDSNDILNLKNDTYVLFTYNNYCSFSVPCDQVFEKFMKKYDIDFLSIPFEDFKKTKFYETIKYGPSIIIIKNDEIVAYLDANSDEDLNRYEDTKEFELWMNKYIYFKK